MITQSLLHIILLLVIVWLISCVTLVLRILYFTKSDKELGLGEDDDTKPSKTSPQPHRLVGKTQTYVSPALPAIPQNTPSENSVEKANTFAAQNASQSEVLSDEMEDTAVAAESGENEMVIDYTMNEEDEDLSLREELQISHDPMPDVSPTAILTRDLARIQRWSKQDDALVQEEPMAVTHTLQSLRGSELMAKYTEALEHQAELHRQLLTAIRKVEETEDLEDSKQDATTTPHTQTTTATRPLEFYL